MFWRASGGDLKAKKIGRTYRITRALGRVSEIAMADAIARDKFHCPSCGADAHWNPAKQALVCPYCGTIAPGKMDEAAGEIVEHDLVTALREFPKATWMEGGKNFRQMPKLPGNFCFRSNIVGQRCNFCGSSQLVPYEQIKAPISPESLLPFKVAETGAGNDARVVDGSRWFAPTKLKNSAHTDTVKGVYLPGYLDFRCPSPCRLDRESGYYYYKTEITTDANGIRLRLVRYNKPAGNLGSGSVDHFFDDELVPASRGVNRNCCAR